MKLTAPNDLGAVDAESPLAWAARTDAREWFRDNRGATWTEYDTWVREEYEPRILTGYGWRRGQRLTAAMRAALDDAHAGLAQAAVDEARRRAGRDVPLAGHRSAVGRSAGPGAGVGTPNVWWDGLQRDGAA